MGSEASGLVPPRTCLRCRVGFWADPPTNPIPFCPQCLPAEKSRPDCPLCGRPKPRPRRAGLLVSMCLECFERRRREKKRDRMRATHRRGSSEEAQRADAAYPDGIDFRNGVASAGERIRREQVRQAGAARDWAALEAGASEASRSMESTYG